MNNSQLIYLGLAFGGGLLASLNLFFAIDPFRLREENERIRHLKYMFLYLAFCAYGLYRIA